MRKKVMEIGLMSEEEIWRKTDALIRGSAKLRDLTALSCASTRVYNCVGTPERPENLPEPQIAIEAVSPFQAARQLRAVTSLSGRTAVVNYSRRNRPPVIKPGDSYEQNLCRQSNLGWCLPGGGEVPTTAWLFT
jgi:hypothetical protein